MEKNLNKELFKELKETKHKLKIAGFTISIMFGICNRSHIYESQTKLPRAHSP